MQIMVLCFTLALFIGCIYCFKNKLYLYFFIPCFLFLPDYYGIDISDALPVISVSRIFLILFAIYVLKYKRRSINFSTIKNIKIPSEYYFLFTYFILRIISNLRYITTYNQAYKTIFSIVIEQFFLLLAFYLLSPTKEEYITLLKSVVWTSNILFLVGIFESITFIKPFDILYTVSRGIINESQIKFGLLRATTTMLMPIIYGNVCVLLFPLILYVYEITRKKIYIVSSVLCFLAIIHSGCRSSVLYFITILGIYFILIINKKDRRIQFSKTLTVVIICFLVIYTFLPTNLHFYYSATTKSVLNEVGFNFDVNEGAPNESMKISMTGRGSTPRIVQLSGIYYTAKHHPIFGFGAGAQNRDDLKYYFYQKWQTIHTFDNGLVEIFCSEGIIGTLALASLLIFITLNIHKRKFYLLSFIAYLLTTISTINLFTFLFFIIAININWDYKPE